MVVPDPPNDLRPRVITWAASHPFSRVHPLEYHPTEFHWTSEAEVQGRFHFFKRADGIVAAVLYGAETVDAAIAEVLFRNVPVRGVPRAIALDDLHGLGISVVTPKRDLALIELLGHGLRRLQVTAEELTSTGADDYPRTVAWAHRLFESVRRADGLVWMSRQFNAAQALMLFGDRVAQDDLDSSEPLELSFGEGLDLVKAAASAAGIVVIP
jgi:hypothetical protein